MDKREDEIFKRIGKFSICVDYIGEFPHAMMQILSNFLIVKAETLHFERTVEYYAYSTLFDPVPLGNEVPRYVWKMTSNGLVVRRIELLEVEEEWHTPDERTILDMINKKEQVTIYSRKLLLPKKKRG